jgi:flagellar biosynthesis anti-sigma factor FlgM
MTDPISMYGRLGRFDPGARSSSSERTAGSGSESAVGSANGAPAAAAGTGDAFVPSDVGRQAMEVETFDKAKVEAIKDALRRGDYPLDSRRIAESFVAMERLIDG